MNINNVVEVIKNLHKGKADNWYWNTTINCLKLMRVRNDTVDMKRLNIIGFLLNFQTSKDVNGAPFKNIHSTLNI